MKWESDLGACSAKLNLVSVLYISETGNNRTMYNPRSWECRCFNPSGTSLIMQVGNPGQLNRANFDNTLYSLPYCLI